MTQKPNNENDKKEDINPSPDSDIQELSDAFTSYMDDVISEEDIYNAVYEKMEKYIKMLARKLGLKNGQRTP